ncbi:type I restriction-modification system, S subunit, putative [Streptococcus pneumoniae]|nr:restriction endonuclease subunit S [Streptococcus pneumoniae]VFI18219.1 type I restriction-modification system, S subunit, putative [Streptococcus pneumoniae]
MKKVKLGEVLSLKKGKKATVLAEQTTLSQRYIQIDDLRNNNNLKFTESLNMTEALPDDILIAWDGANAGTVGYGLSGAVGSTITVLKKNERYKEKIISDYLGVFLESKSQYLREHSTGATIPHLNKNILLDLQLELLGIEEQENIICILNTIKRLITKRKLQLYELNLLVKSRFNEMFGENKIFESIDNLFDIIDGDRGKNYPKSDKSRFNEMFGENKIFESIDNLFDIIDGDRGKNYPKSDELFSEEYCLFLNTKNVTKNGFSFDTKQFITKTKDKLLRKGKLERYDIVLTTRGTVGNVAYYDELIKYKHLRINSGMVILRPKTPNLNQKFIIHVLRNNNYSRVISGSAQPQLPITKLKKILLPLPPLALQNEFADFVAQVDKSQLPQLPITKLKKILLPLPPLALQNEFADFVAQVDKSQLAIQKSLEELETLKKSLMQEYFG